MNRTVKTLTAAIALAAGLLLTGCSSNGYTGTVTVVEHHQNGRHCHATVEIPGQGEKGMSVGSYGRCKALTDGQTLTLENGFAKHND